MALVARSILCIPASSSKSECNFSDAGNTLTAKRNGLKPSTLDTLLFMRSNLDLLKQHVHDCLWVGIADSVVFLSLDA
jgi:hypothetical protein